MASVSVQRVGYLLRVHRRSEWLPVIFKQMQELARGRQAHLVVMADRPSPNVIAALAKIERKMPKNFQYTLIESPAPIRTSAGCRWTETISFMYGHIDKATTQAALLWDDDLIFSDLAMQELRAHLHFLEYDRVEADWLNIADERAETWDSGFLRHRAAQLFRAYPEDDWTDTFTRHIGGGGAQCPSWVAQSSNFTIMDGHVLHMGYCSPDRRQQAWNAAKACGSYDGYFRHLNQEPIPKRCRGPAESSRTLVASLSEAAAQ